MMLAEEPVQRLETRLDRLWQEWLKHRAAIDILTRGYTGADRGRLKSSWRARSTSADAEIAKDGRILRDRMRDLVRNNPHAANAISVLVTHAIGDGIPPVVGEQVDVVSESGELTDGIIDFSTHSDQNPRPHDGPEAVIKHGNVRIELATDKVTIKGDLKIEGKVDIDGDHVKHNKFAMKRLRSSD